VSESWDDAELVVEPDDAELGLDDDDDDDDDDAEADEWGEAADDDE
jgi:hypothetical protein